MRELRNPFKLRASEQIESDDIYLGLFGPDVLDLLQREEIWDRIQIFQSAPGGGKTSLFRLFTPASLLTLYDLRDSKEHKELYYRLKNIGAISERGPAILGIMISCARNYADLQDLRFDRIQKNRLFYALLNSRIMLAALRSALQLKKLTYTNDLNRLQISKLEGIDIPTTIPVPCTGRELYDWASELERQICSTIDSFASPTTDSLLGYDTLYCLSLLRSGCIQIDGQPIATRILLMLDDVHRLTSIQRESLLKILLEFRSPIGIWVAERLEALTSSQLLGATLGREYSEPIRLEEFWRRNGNSGRFEQMVADISNRRMKLSRDLQGTTFENCLQNSLDGAEWQDKYSSAIDTISNRISERTQSTRKYEKWISICQRLGKTTRERAINWRALEIEIERDMGKAQRELMSSSVPKREEELQMNSAIKEAAELFLAHEFGFPYYFGFPCLARLASSNIEQFLELASELLEEAISAKLMKQSFMLHPKRQEGILRRVARRRWEEIPRSIPNGGDAVRLLDMIRQVSLSETYRSNAPYVPGVTGIAISMRELSRMTDERILEQHPRYARLARTLSACISSNLLWASRDRHQGPKGGETWLILYLNRLLCLHFGLPLQYGGWRPLRLDELWQYFDQGFRITTKR